MFGKTLVLLHLGLSLIFATWALVLYTTRTDWTATKGKDGRPDGELVARMADYDKLARGAVRPADSRFREAREKIVKEETGRPVERAWFTLQLEFLASRATEANPARQIERDKDGNITVIPNAPAGADLIKMGPPQDKDGNPMKDRDGKPLVLRSLDYYNKEYNSLMTQETEAMKRRNLAATRDLDATNALKGPRGLHAKIRFESVKQERMKDENAEVRPLWLNTMVEYQNLQALGVRLQERLDELLKLKSRGDKLGR